MYTAHGGVYAAQGGANLALRQQLREWTGNKSRSAVQTARQIRDYRKKYPDKAILCSFEPTDGWAVLAAGGSVPNLPARRDTRLLAALPRMKPFRSAQLTDQQWALAEPGRSYFVYTASGGTIRHDLSGNEETFTVSRINPRTGEVSSSGAVVRGGKVVAVATPGSGTCLVWLTRE